MIQGSLRCTVVENVFGLRILLSEMCDRHNNTAPLSNSGRGGKELRRKLLGRGRSREMSLERNEPSRRVFMLNVAFTPRTRELRRTLKYFLDKSDGGWRMADGGWRRMNVKSNNSGREGGREDTVSCCYQ